MAMLFGKMGSKPFTLYSHIESDFILIAGCSDKSTMTLQLLSKKTQIPGKLEKVTQLNCLQNKRLTFEFSPTGGYFMHVTKRKKNNLKLNLYKIASLEIVKAFTFSGIKKVMPLTF